MAKWEYRIERAIALLGDFKPKNLNELGEQGWEAVGVFYESKASQTYVLFKRQKE